MKKTKKSRQQAVSLEREQSRTRVATILGWACVVLVVVFVACVRIRLLQVPLERDEGEYTYMGQLMLRGVPPYLLAYNMKLPGIYAAYALIMAIFGQSIAGIHLGLLLVNVAAIVLVFILASRLLCRTAAVAACATYAILSLSSSVLGFAAHATHFVVLPALAGILLLLKFIETGRASRLFWSGLLLGTAFIAKQPGIFYCLFAAGYLVWSQKKTPGIRRGERVRNAAVFSVAAALPYALTCLAIFLVGTFPRFWFWTFTYAREYATTEPISEAPRVLSEALPRVIGQASLLWILSGIGLTAIAWNPQARRHAGFLLGFVALSVLAVCPGFYFRQHYFILALPAVALLVGVAVEGARGLFVRMGASPILRLAPMVAFAAILAYTINQQAPYLFAQTPLQICRSTYGGNPFPEAIQIGDYIRRHTGAGDTVAVLGSEPEIYFYAGRFAATGYIYMYDLMDEKPFASYMQREAIHQIELSRPKYMVFVNVPTSWLRKAHSDATFLSWCSGSLQRSYVPVGFADILDAENYETAYYWDDDAVGRLPQSPLNVLVFKRKGSG